MKDFICIDSSDSIVYNVASRMKERQNVGLRKYGVTMDRKDLSAIEWINHAQEEIMDLLLYLEKLKSEIK